MLHILSLGFTTEYGSAGLKICICKYCIHPLVSVSTQSQDYQKRVVAQTQPVLFLYRALFLVCVDGRYRIVTDPTHSTVWS